MIIVDLQRFIFSNKHEAFVKFKEHLNVTTNKFHWKVQFLWSDRGGEYTGKDWKFSSDYGTEHQLTVAYCPS